MSGSVSMIDGHIDEVLKPCKCGRIPEIVETFDTLQVICSCGECGEKFYGDYYDESFMFATYGGAAIEEWNRRADA